MMDMKRLGVIKRPMRLYGKGSLCTVLDLVAFWPRKYGIWSMSPITPRRPIVRAGVIIGNVIDSGLFRIIGGGAGWCRDVYGVESFQSRWQSGFDDCDRSGYRVLHFREPSRLLVTNNVNKGKGLRKNSLCLQITLALNIN